MPTVPASCWRRGQAAIADARALPHDSCCSWLGIVDQLSFRQKIRLRRKLRLVMKLPLLYEGSIFYRYWWSHIKPDILYLPAHQRQQERAAKQRPPVADLQPVHQRHSPFMCCPRGFLWNECFALGKFVSELALETGKS